MQRESQKSRRTGVSSKLDIPTEYQEACTFVDWLELQKQQGLVIDYCHVANESYGGTRADMLRGAKLKRQGRKPGVFDYEVFVKRIVRHVVNPDGVRRPEYECKELRVELKRQRGGVISDEQEHWQNVYGLCGIPAKVCRGAGEAIEFVERYIT